MGKRWPMSETATLEEPKAAKVWASWDNPLLTPEGWQEVRRAVEAGMSMPEAAVAFGVTLDAIKQRSSREEWLTEKRIQKLAAEAISRRYENVQKSPLVTEPEKPAGEAILPQKSALESVAASLEGYRSRTLLKLAKLAEKGVEKAIDANLNIENWQDAKIAAELALKLHAPQASNSVQVNVLTDGSASFDVEDFPVIDAEES